MAVTTWKEVIHRPNDKERQDAYESGVGDYGGEDTRNKEVRQTTMPNTESS